MDSNTFFPPLSTTIPNNQSLHGAVGLSNSASHDHQYAALPSSHEMKDLISGLSNGHSGKSDQFQTSGVDYWKNSQQVHDIMQKLLKVSADVKQDTQTPIDAASASTLDQSQTSRVLSSDLSSTALNSKVPIMMRDALVIDNPIYDQGGAGGSTWYFTGNPFNYNNINPIQGFDPSGEVRHYLSNNGYTWADNNASYEDGAVPNIPQPGYSDSTTNKYLLQDWSQTSGNAISTKLLGHVFTPQENSDWVSVITQDVKHNGWLIPRVWLQIYETVAHYPEVQSDLNNFQTQILDRTSANFDMQWTNWAQDTMAHGYSLDQMRSNIAHSDAATAALKQVIQDVQGRTPTDNDMTWVKSQEDAMGNGSETLNQVYQGLALWDGEHGGYDWMITDVLGRAAGASDEPWRQWVEQAIGNRSETYASVQSNLAFSQVSHDNIITAYQTEVNFTPTESQIQSWQTQLSNGTSAFWQMQNAIAHGSEARTALIGLYQKDTSITPTDADLQTQEDKLAAGTSFSSLEQSFAYSDETRTAVTALIQRESGITAPSTSLLDYFSQQIASGKSYSDMTASFAYGNEVRGAATALIQNEADIQAPSNGLLDYFSQSIASGKSLQEMKLSFAYGNEVTTALGEGSGFFLGHPIDQTGLSTWQSAIANGESLTTVYSAMAQSPEAWAQLRSVYSDWGQLPPTDAQLKTAGQAIFNLHAAWIIAKDQTADQLQAEANGYQALSANSSFQDYIDNVAGSAEQARDLEASMLADPLMEEADNVQDARNLLTQGGGSVEEAMVDQGVMRTVIQQDKENPLTPCNDVATFRNAHTKVVYNNPQITSANAQWQTVNQRDWSASYVANGVVWNEDRGGAGASAQGLPYEAYVQEKLNGGNPTGDYVWLQDHRSNWMTFDHWNENTRDAVSDKALNTNRDMYKTNPANIKYRIWADIKEMAMKYTQGSSREGTTKLVSFTQEDIQTYTFELGVRAATTTDAQWKQICEAYRGAGAKMTSYEQNGYKPLDFEIDAISDAVS